MKQRQSLYFLNPFEFSIHWEPIPSPGPGEVLVRSDVSAISPGTEMLFYRDQVPVDMVVDATIGAFGGRFSYPLKYGYAVVGRVLSLGQHVDSGWLGMIGIHEV